MREGKCTPVSASGPLLAGRIVEPEHGGRQGLHIHRHHTGNASGDFVIKRYHALGELDEYFAGKRTEFTIPVVFTGSEFQCRVWAELIKIPYGETISYGELARRISNPKAVRAVASANAPNPISIFVPCHRVIGSNHKLTGYGGGLVAKQELLALEATFSVKPCHFKSHIPVIRFRYGRIPPCRFRNCRSHTIR